MRADRPQTEALAPATPRPPAPEQIVAENVPRLLALAAALLVALDILALALHQPFVPVFDLAVFAMLAGSAAGTAALARRGLHGAVVHVLCVLVLLMLVGSDRVYGGTAGLPAAYLIPVVLAIGSSSRWTVGGYGLASLAAFAVAAANQHATVTEDAAGQVWQTIETVASGAFLIAVTGVTFRAYRRNVRAAYAELAARYTQTQLLNERLSLATGDMLDMLIATLDARESETAGHSQRVSRMAWEIARALRVEGQELEHIRRGALLHDIGKIRVPDAVLLKPASLDDREWVVMRRHAEDGYRLLEAVPFLVAEAALVRAHHERWDGRGYPTGLRGKDIPLGARIFAVADTYDAITSDRAYRKARCHEEATKIIGAESGHQFDPVVVDTFMRLYAGVSMARDRVA
jgi:putative nucleotidyltransferase with HDIG domain